VLVSLSNQRSHAVTNKKNYTEVVRAAARETASFMTTTLRDEAINSGWDIKVSNSLKVNFKGDAFVIDIPQRHKDAADAHEFGTEDDQPNPVLRRFANRLQEPEKFMLLRASKMVGKL
jgi:hypothetical protein